MRRWFLVLFVPAALLMVGCVTYEVNEKGERLKTEDDQDLTKLVFDSNGRFLAVATRLIPPHTLIVNGGKPTEREIRLLGVEGLPERAAPNTYARCQEWMAKFLSRGETLYIKLQEGADTEQRVIYGEVYMEAVDPKTGEPLVDQYVMVNMAMLSQGLVKLRDVREFGNPQIQRRMREVEDEARREKKGLWSDKP